MLWISSRPVTKCDPLHGWAIQHYPEVARWVTQLSRSGNMIKWKTCKSCEQQTSFKDESNNSGNQEMIWATQFSPMSGPVGDTWIWDYPQHCITWTHVDLSSEKSIDIHVGAISQEIPQWSIIKSSLKIVYLKLHSNLPGAIQLIVEHTHDTMYLFPDISSISSRAIEVTLLCQGVWVNSLTPGICSCNFKCNFQKHD